SPFVGGEVVSGPAAKLMASTGLEPSTKGVYEAYSDFVDVLVADDAEEVGEVVRRTDCDFVNADTMMESRDDARALFETIREEI
ncbi:MAG: 2-phospho-L-lactate transferase, partial [Halobacteria archaeon]|nr:2-phospho-L-lactate transferase [Halobacteria archaeon]